MCNVCFTGTLHTIKMLNYILTLAVLGMHKHTHQRQ